jgi:hypothetical protein
MKNLLLLSTLTLSLMFSAGSWAEWTYLYESDTGNKTYVDFDGLRKANGLVYYWSITDLLEPAKGGTMSYKIYSKVDCDTMREMKLSMSVYNLLMAEGTAEYTFTPDPEWLYAQPDSVLEATLNAVCAH